MSLFVMTFIALSRGETTVEDRDGQAHPIRHAQSNENAAQVGANGGFMQPQGGSDLLVLLPKKDHFHDPRLLGGKVQRADGRFPFRCARGGVFDWSGSFLGGSSLAAHELAPKKRASNQGRSANPRQGAYRTCPGRRPFRGAGTRHWSCIQTWRFSLNQRLDARASIQLSPAPMTGVGGR